MSFDLPLSPRETEFDGKTEDQIQLHYLRLKRLKQEE